MKNFRKGQLAKFDILTIKWHGAKVSLSSQAERTFPFSRRVRHTVVTGSMEQKFANARSEPVLILSGPRYAGAHGTYYKTFIFNEYFWINDVHLLKFSE